MPLNPCAFNRTEPEMATAAAVAMLPGLNQTTGGRFPPLYVTESTWAMAVLIAVALALAVGLPPAWRAHRLRIVDALAGHR